MNSGWRSSPPVDLTALSPPHQVRDVFDRVTTAEQTADERISAAHGDAQRTLNSARGQAAAVLAAAETYRQEIVNDTAADAARFTELEARFREHPDILSQTLHQDTCRRVLAAVSKRYIVHGPGEGDTEIRILLNPRPASVGRPSRAPTADTGNRASP